WKCLTQSQSLGTLTKHQEWSNVPLEGQSTAWVVFAPSGGGCEWISHPFHNLVNCNGGFVWCSNGFLIFLFPNGIFNHLLSIKYSVIIPCVLSRLLCGCSEAVNANLDLPHVFSKFAVPSWNQVNLL